MSSNDPDFPPIPNLGSSLYLEYKEAVYDTLFTGIVCGAYIVVYVISVHAVLSKPGFSSSPPRMFMFGITTLMFALAIIALGLQTTLEFLSTTFQLYSYSNYVWATITCLTYILCDIICAWRTVVLWNRDNRIIAILVLFILGTIAAAGYALATGLPTTILVSGEIFYGTAGKVALYTIGPSLATNLLSIGLIAWKAWQRRITVGKHLREGSSFLRVDRVFALLIESGLIYCCIWILYWIWVFGLFPPPSLNFLVFVSGLYPTLIIILVSKHLSPVEHYSTQPDEMQFTDVLALGQPRESDGGMP